MSVRCRFKRLADQWNYAFWTLTTTTKNRCPVWICSICAWVASHLKGQRTGEFLSFEPQPCVTPSDKYHFGSAENLRKAWVKPKTTLGQNTWNVNLYRKLRAVPGCRCQIAQDHYQKQRDLTLNCTQQDREQKPRSTWQVNLLLQPVIFRQGAQHRRCRSLIFESTITRDCERHEFRNTVNIFLFPLGNQCWTHLCLVRHFWFVPKREKKVRLEGHFLFTTRVDDQCRQCPSKSRALSEA